MKETFARLVSSILNPFVVAVTALVLLAFQATPTASEALLWIAVSIAVSVLPVVVVVLFLVRLKKLDGFFSNPREQRNSVYLLASALGVIDCVLYWYLHAPRLLSVLFTAGLIAVIIFMVINYYWKISLHTAFVTGAVVVLVIILGWKALFSVAFIPLVAWSRLVLKQHTIPQVIVGGLLSVIIVAGIFWSFGAIG
jgi:membrane-associated phospholipid phosphatase